MDVNSENKATCTKGTFSYEGQDFLEIPLNFKIFCDFRYYHIDNNISHLNPIPCYLDAQIKFIQHC